MNNMKMEIRLPISMNIEIKEKAKIFRLSKNEIINFCLHELRKSDTNRKIILENESLTITDKGKLIRFSIRTNLYNWEFLKSVKDIFGISYYQTIQIAVQKFINTIKDV